MIDIPEETLATCFEKYFVFGSVWRKRNYIIPATGEKRDKYLLILIPKADDNSSYFILPTSKVERYLSALYSEDCIIIEKGQVPFFYLRTAVSLNLHRGYYSSIKGDYINAPFTEKLEYVGKLPGDILNRLYDLIMDSKSIAPRIKNQIPAIP